MRQKLAHITLVVDDYDKAISYYTTQLNFTLVEDTVLSEDKRWVLVSPEGKNGFSLLLAKASNPAQQSRIGDQTGGRVFLFLHTSDITAYAGLLKSKGVEFIRQPEKMPYGTVAVFKDVYGNLWDLIEPANTQTII